MNHDSIHNELLLLDIFNRIERQNGLDYALIVVENLLIIKKPEESQ